MSKVDSLNPQSFHQQGRAAPYDVRKDESRPWTSIHGTSPVAMWPNLTLLGCLKQRGGHICRLYIHDISQGMAKCIKCMIRCDRATSCKKKDFLSRRLRQGCSRCTSSMPRNLQRLCRNSAPTALKLSTRTKPNLSYKSNTSKTTPWAHHALMNPFR